MTEYNSSITGPQLRAARGFLNWSRDECARAAGISPETIKNIETGRYKAYDATFQALIKCLTENGVGLVDGDGVRRIEAA